MRSTPYGGRIVHGALLIGYMSTTDKRECVAHPKRRDNSVPRLRPAALPQGRAHRRHHNRNLHHRGN
jgi:hypothetical protein